MKQYNRRTFLTNIAALGGAGALSYFVPPALAQLITPGDKRRPLEMLALGDSVIWGQGLKDEFKFVLKVRTWLEKEIGNKVNLDFNQPHSGATIFPEIDKRKTFHGEVNNASPSILQQVENSRKYYETRPAKSGGPLTPELVDLVIVDGGINDVEAPSIVIANRKSIAKKANTYCFEGMKVLLNRIAKTYPNARILVTGYFPLISEATNPTEFLDDLLLVFGPNKIQPMISAFGKRILNFLPARLRLRTILSERSKTWHIKSDEALQKAVDDFNGKNSIPSKSIQFTAVNPRAYFVKSDFKDPHCYGVDRTTYLWRIRENTRTNDDLSDERNDKICKVRNGSPLGLLTCNRAGAFHPNREGAEAYAVAIKKKLARDVLPLTGWVPKVI
jgi:lysophospholipase L1-like esterase